jgi:hypothetical protein
MKIRSPTFSMAGKLMTSKGTYEKSPGAGSYDTRGNLLGRSPGKSMGLKTDPKV